MAKPNLTSIIEMMKRGGDFELTGQQYKSKTKADFLKGDPTRKTEARLPSILTNCDEQGILLEVRRNQKRLGRVAR